MECQQMRQAALASFFFASCLPMAIAAPSWVLPLQLSLLLLPQLPQPLVACGSPTASQVPDPASPSPQQHPVCVS